jgi:hypothetical protein
MVLPKSALDREVVRIGGRLCFAGENLPGPYAQLWALPRRSALLCLMKT